MKIGVISDTHLKEATPELTGLLAGPFRDVEMILHAGDITELAVLEGLEKKKVQAVWGNMDSSAVRRALPAKRIITAGNFRIGLIHGGGGPQGITERLSKEFTEVHCIVFGHTHAPLTLRQGDLFWFNSGSFRGDWVSGKKSIGLLHVGDQITGEILWL